MSATSVHIGIDWQAPPPTVELLAIPDGRRFVLVRLGDGVNFQVPGWDQGAVDWARAFAKNLTDAAAGLEEKLAGVAAEGVLCDDRR